MVVGNQAARSASSVMARQTRSRRLGQPALEAQDREVADPLECAELVGRPYRSRPDLLLARFHDFEVAFQRVEVARPLPAIGSQPLVHLAQRLGAHPVDPALSVRPGFDQAGLPQDLEVLGDGRLAQGEEVDEITDAALPLGPGGPGCGAGSPRPGPRKWPSHWVYFSKGIYPVKRFGSGCGGWRLRPLPGGDAAQRRHGRRRLLAGRQGAR